MSTLDYQQALGRKIAAERPRRGGGRAPAISTLRSKTRKAWDMTHAGRYTELTEAWSDRTLRDPPSRKLAQARACCCLTPTRPEGGRGATRD